MTTSTGVPREEAMGHGAMLAFSAFVAGSFSLGAQVANDISPVALNAVRFWLAAAVVMGFLAVRGVSFAPLRVAPWRYGVLGGLFAMYFVLMLEGLKTAAPVSTAAVFTLMPLLTAGVSWLLLRQVLTPRMAIALALGGAGALWVIFRADLAAFLAFQIGKGEAIYFVGCIAHAFYIPLVRVLARGESTGLSTLGTLIAGGVVLTLLGANILWQTEWTSLSLKVWLVIGYVGIVASAISVALLQFASMRLPGAKVMAYTYLTPVWVIVWEVAQGRPAPSPILLVGVGAALLALGLLMKSEAR